MRRDRLLLCGEIENVIGTMPERATIRHTGKPEDIAWFGRSAAAIEKWNPLKSSLAKQYIDLFLNDRLNLQCEEFNSRYVNCRTAARVA